MFKITEEYLSNSLKNKINNKSDIGHTHPEYAFSGHSHTQYSPTGHTHPEYSVTGHTHSEYVKTVNNISPDEGGNIVIDLPEATEFSLYVDDTTISGDGTSGSPLTVIQVPHTHQISGVTGLQTALDGKALKTDLVVFKDANGSGVITQHNTASGVFSFATGVNNAASGDTASVCGQDNKANGTYSFAAGYNNTAGFAAMAVGQNNTASGLRSFVGGYNVKATGSYAYNYSYASSTSFIGAAAARSAILGGTDNQIQSGATGAAVIASSGATATQPYTLYTDNLVVKGTIKDSSGNTYTVGGGSTSGTTNTPHTHQISDVTNLQAALDGKASTGHTHTGLIPSGGTDGQLLVKNGATDYSTKWIATPFYNKASYVVTPATISRTYTSTGGNLFVQNFTIATPDGLITANTVYQPQYQNASEGQHRLASIVYDIQQSSVIVLHGTSVPKHQAPFKASFSGDRYTVLGEMYIGDGIAVTATTGTTHTHTISEVTDLQGALDSKAGTGHTHSEYALTSHQHNWTDLNGIPATFAPSAHTHYIDEIQGLQGIINGLNGMITNLQEQIDKLKLCTGCTDDTDEEPIDYYQLGFDKGEFDVNAQVSYQGDQCPAEPPMSTAQCDLWKDGYAAGYGIV